MGFTFMSTTYQIHLKGQLDPKHSDWFGDFTLSHTEEGNTLLTGIIVDQAALHGVLARCRDLGITLISINPLPQENTMNHAFQVEASAVIDARPEDIYAVISDYHVGHPAIVPKPYFEEIKVEKGGQGAGTVIRLKMKIFGQEYNYHQIVTEPEPGRVLVETDINTGQYSKFIVEPVGKQTQVTIFAHFPGKPGIAGLIEKWMNPLITRQLFKKELRQLADYVHSNH